MKTKRINLALKYAVMLILTAIFLIPIYYMLITTFKTTTEVAVAPMALPQSISFAQYRSAFESMQYPRAFSNTFVITAVSVVGLLFVTSMCGYVLNRKSNKLTNTIFIVLLAGMMFPYQMSILGLYRVVQTLGLMNNIIGIILIDIAVNVPYATFLMRSFASTIPIELEEAARIDGAGVFQTYGKVILPLMKPMLATVGILNALSIWNDFMGPLYFLHSRENGVILQEIYRNVGQFSTDWIGLFCMMVLGILPLLVFYLVMQRFIIGGVMSGSIKG